MKPLVDSTDRTSPGRSALSLARRLWPVPVVAALIAAGYFGYRRWQLDGADVAYTTSALERGDIVQSVTASGTLQPVVQSTVGAQVSGRITELLVDFNDHVRKGDVLARLDRQIFSGQVAQAKARLVSARAELGRAQAAADNARAVDRRTASLLTSGAVAQSEVEAARAARRSAEAAILTARSGIVEAQAAVENAEANLTYTTITAPIDGVVVSRSVDVGQTVAASLQAPTLFVIAGDLAKMELHTSVAEADVGQVGTGMRVELAFDAYPDKTFVGLVKQVRNQATTVSNVVTYDAVVAVDNPGGELRPGMTATATFVVAERRGVLVVPQKAIRYRPKNAEPGPSAPAQGARGPRQPTARREPSGRGPAVWVLRAGAPARVPLQIGLTDGARFEVTAGELKEGDLVVTADSTTPTAGDARGGSRARTAGGPPRLF